MYSANSIMFGIIADSRNELVCKRSHSGAGLLPLRETEASRTRLSKAMRGFLAGHPLLEPCTLAR